MQSESGVDINIRRFLAETLFGQTQGFSLNVQRLGLSPNTVQTCSHASLGLVLVDHMDALYNQARAVHLDALDDPLQEALIVLALEEREVGLDSVEGGAVGHVEDRPRSQALSCLEDLLSLVHLQIVHEDGELLPKELG